MSRRSTFVVDPVTQISFRIYGHIRLEGNFEERDVLQIKVSLSYQGGPSVYLYRFGNIAVEDLNVFQSGMTVGRVPYFGGELTEISVDQSRQFSHTLTFHGELQPGRLEFPDRGHFEIEPGEFEIDFRLLRVVSNRIRVNPSQQQVTIIEASE